MRILLFGRDGMLAWELCRALGPLGPLVALGRVEADVAKEVDLRTTIRRVRPTLVINAAGYTSVDRAEGERELCWNVNAVAPRIMAEEASRLQATLLHISTDYVFDGRKQSPYDEEDVPNPVNFYGETKLAGELAIREEGGRHVIVRTSWVYGIRRENFLTAILQAGRESHMLRVVDDQIGSPTWARQFAAAMPALIRLMVNGREATPAFQSPTVLHYSASGEASWYDFANRILETAPEFLLASPRPKVDRIPARDSGRKAARPRFSALASDRFGRLTGELIVPWETQLASLWESLREGRDGKAEA